MDVGGGDGGGSFKVKHGFDAAEVTDVHETEVGEVRDVVGEGEMRMKSNTKIAGRASAVKVVEEELLDRCIEGSEIFLIWAGRHIMINSVFERLRQRRLEEASLITVLVKLFFREDIAFQSSNFNFIEVTRGPPSGLQV